LPDPADVQQHDPERYAAAQKFQAELAQEQLAADYRERKLEQFAYRAWQNLNDYELMIAREYGLYDSLLPNDVNSPGYYDGPRSHTLDEAQEMIEKLRFATHESKALEEAKKGWLDAVQMYEAFNRPSALENFRRKQEMPATAYNAKKLRQTQNPAHGFYGGMNYTDYPEDPAFDYVETPEAEWQAAMTGLVDTIRLTEKDAQTFLDSTAGRHLAEELIDLRVKQEDKTRQITDVEKYGGIERLVRKLGYKPRMAPHEAPRAEVLSPYAKGEAMYKRGPDTHSGMGMKKLLLSLDERGGFSLSDCVRHFDNENRALAREIVTHFIDKGSDGELCRICIGILKDDPSLKAHSTAADELAVKFRQTGKYGQVPGAILQATLDDLETEVRLEIYNALDEELRNIGELAMDGSLHMQTGEPAKEFMNTVMLGIPAYLERERKAAEQDEEDGPKP